LAQEKVGSSNAKKTAEKTMEIPVRPLFEVSVANKSKIDANFA